jgi:TonB family protein
MARFDAPRENLLITGLYAFCPGDGVLLPLRTMAPLIKDSLDVANSTTAAPASQTSAPPKQAAPSSPTLRANALSLEVPVKVHGSRVTEVARGVAPHTEPFEEETGTMIVFPHGGVLRMSTAVTASQMLVVTNLKTRQDAICRVVKVRTFSNMQGYVEVEFTHQQPGYWGVHFPSEGSAQASASEPALAIPPAAPAAIPEAPINPAPVRAALTPPPFVAPPAPAVISPAPPPPIVMTPVPPVAPIAPAAFNPPAPVIPAPPSKPEPTFISFGTQEKVQPFASTTTVTAAERIAQSSLATPAQTRPEAALPVFISETPGTSASHDAQHHVAPIDLLAAPQVAAPPPALTMTELRGDQRGMVAAPPAEAPQAVVGAQQATADGGDAPAQSSRAVFGSFSGGTALSGSHAVPVDAFGARLDSGHEAGADQPGASRSNSWMLIAACVTLLFATVVGGVMYFRPHAAALAHNGAANSNSPAVPQPLAFQTPAAAPDQTTPDVMPPHNSATHPVAVVAQAPALTSSIVVNGNNASNDGPRIVPKPASNLAPGMVKDALENHPVSTQRSDVDQSVQAPSVDAAPVADSSNAGALSGIVSSNVAAPAAPEIQGEGPVKIGGNVKEPRLAFRVMPEYPLVAKQAGIQGDVVVKTTIDQKGNVVNMQIVSGPAMLRGPALAALRRWRYEPSTLNGQPISVQMFVTIKFSANR